MNTTTPAHFHVTRSGRDRRRNLAISDLILLRLPDVQALCGLSRSSIYAAIQRDAFPRPIKLNAGRASAWIKAEVVAWMEQCIQNSRSNASERRQRPSR